MQRHRSLRASILLLALISLASLTLGQNQGAFQSSINYYAGPPSVASNTGYLFGGVMPIEAHTRDSMGRPLDLDGDGKADVVVAVSCSNYEFPGCPASSYAIATYLGNGDGTFKLCTMGGACAPPYGIISGGPATALRSIAVGDFNGDGKMDVVAASDSSSQPNSGSLTILLGNGDGTFSAGQTYVLNGIVSQANTITVGDLNGDGWPDIAVGLACYDIPDNSCSVGAVSIYLNNGDGTFSGPTIYQTVGNGALYPVVGDFNGDGKLDVIAGSPYAPNTYSLSSLTILLGNGDGTFSQQFYNGQPAKTLPFYGLSGLAAVDLNSDGRLDLAITAQAYLLEIVAGNGDGTFQDNPTAYNTNLGNGSTNGAPIITTDLNGDGKPDLIVSGTGGQLGQFNAAQVFLNDGSGNLIAGGTYMAGGWLYAPIDVADFNGDGKIDVVLVSGCAEDEAAGGQLCPDGTLTVLLGNGDGTMRGARYLPSGTSYGRGWSVAAADFNGDGFQDLVFPGCAAGQSCPSDGITVLLSDGAGGYQAPLFFPSPATQGFYLTVADFNGDGRPDVALFSSCDQGPYNCNGEAVSVFLNSGDANNLFSTAAVYESGGTSMAPLAIATGDFDGKNGPDIALLHCCTSDGKNLIGVLLNQGDGTFGAQAPDQHAITTEATNAYWIAAADFDGDGKADLAVSESTTDPYAPDPYAGLVQILISNGDGTFTPGNSYSSGGDRSDGFSSITVASGDVNGDGKADIVLGNVCDQRSNSGNYIYDDINCARGAIGVLLGDGKGNFSSPANLQTPTVAVVADGNFSAVSLADVNGDGKLDVIASTLTGIYVAFGNGDGTFQPGTIYAGLRVDQNVQLAVADLNNDGALDIVQPGNAYQGQLAILYNQGPGNSSVASTTAILAPPITYGDTANITVSVTSGQNTVTGNVSLAVDSGSPITQALSGGSSTFTISGLTGGSHSLTASFAAQNGFAASSATGSQQVQQAQPTVSFTGAPASASYNSTFTVTATTNASTTATITASGSCSVSGTTVAMTSGAGICNLTASWPADNNYVAASASQSTTATTAATTTTITSNTPNPSVTGQAVTVNFSVTGNGIPTGNVTVSDGTGDSCTATVAAGTCMLTPTSAGAKMLSATYAGDNNFSASTSSGVAQTVNKASTTTAITGQMPNPSVAGQPVMVNFSVVVIAPGGGALSGTVTVSDGLGDSCSAVVSAGNCSLIFASAGSKTMSATYSGDGNFSSSSSTGVAHSVMDFSMSSSPASQSVKAGGKVSYKVTLSPLNGFTGTISFSCSGAPPNSTCTAPKPLKLTKMSGVSFAVATSKSTPKGTYPLTFTGIFGSGVPATGGLTRSTSVTLTIN